jgi:hypothetical protein
MALPRLSKPAVFVVRLFALVLAASGLVACESADEAPGLLPANRSQPGPTIVFKPLERPEPDIPFPNDLALWRRADGQTYVNVSVLGDTGIDSRNREHFNRVEGFSGLTPISVSFDGPLDVSTANDDTVLVLNITPGSKRFGEKLVLDLGRGWYPHTAEPHPYFPNDPLAAHNSYVLPPDNLIDTDGDKKPDKWVNHYEVSTNTLDIRPLMPLEAGAQYAVVLTRGIKGWDKEGKYGPIRSPFDAINHDTQTNDLKRVLPILKDLGVKDSDVAFAWTLTTGDLARTYRALREGLYGRGQFKWLDKMFPPKINEIYNMSIDFDAAGDYPADNPYPKVERDTLYTLQGAYVSRIFGLLAQFIPAGTMENVSHMVFGDFDTPNFRATPDNVWRIDVPNGTADVDMTKFREKVPFLLTVPKTTDKHKPPFPVVVYAHATATSRIESLLMADKLAEAGIAVFAIDAVGHGPVLADPLKYLKEQGDYVDLVASLLPIYLYREGQAPFGEDTPAAEKFDMMLKNGFVQQLALKGRATDDNQDCQIKGGEDYYTPNAFRLRDAMRQTTWDYIVAVRLLRSLTQDKVPAPPQGDVKALSYDQLKPSLLAGDFDLDGVVDIGGPNVPYYMTGISLGGIHTALTAPLEPYIVGAAPVVPGAGLADIFMRTKLHDVVTPLMHWVSGPQVVGCPGDDGKVRLSWNDDSDECKKSTRKVWRDPKTGACSNDQFDIPSYFDELEVPNGAIVSVTNKKTGRRNEQVVSNGRFAVPMAADKNDPFRIEVRLSNGTLLQTLDIKTPHEGLGKTRNTPEFRKFVQLAANVLEGADAITVADRVLLDPIPGYPATNMLMMLSVGDRTVPFTTGVTLARAVGLFGRADPTGKQPWWTWFNSPQAPYREWFEKAIEMKLLERPDLSPPPLSDVPDPVQQYCRIVETVPGQPERSGLCLADVLGHHEYIAQPKDSDKFPAINENGPDGKPYRATFTEFHRNLIVSYFHSVGKRILTDPCKGQLSCKGTETPTDRCWGDPKCVTDRKMSSIWAEKVGTGW